MTRNNYLFILIMPLIFLSACTFPDFFGSDVIKPNEYVQTESPVDVLTISDIRTIPNSPIIPDQAIILSFVITNNDKTRTIRNVVVDLFDAPLFKSFGDINSRILCNSPKKPCQPDPPEAPQCSLKHPCDILPGEQKFIIFNLIAPSENEIAQLNTDVTLSFKVNYKFDGTTLYRVSVVNMDEIKLRQREGKQTEIDIPTFKPSGPVKVDIRLRNQPYILSGFGATFVFVIEDMGSAKSGVNNSVITPEGLHVVFPVELFNSETVIGTPDGDKFQVSDGKILPYKNPDDPSQTGPDKFGCVGKDQQTDTPHLGTIGITLGKENAVRCWNKLPEQSKTGTEGNIDLYRKKSIPLQFIIDKVNTISEPFRTYDIKAIVAYDYELRDSVNIQIYPLRR